MRDICLGALIISSMFFLLPLYSLAAGLGARSMTVEFQVEGEPNKRIVSVKANKRDSKQVRRFKDLLQRCIELEANEEKITSGSVVLTLADGKIKAIKEFNGVIPDRVQACIRSGVEKDPAPEPLKISK